MSGLSVRFFEGHFLVLEFTTLEFGSSFGWSDWIVSMKQISRRDLNGSIPRDVVKTLQRWNLGPGGFQILAVVAPSGSFRFTNLYSCNPIVCAPNGQVKQYFAYESRHQHGGFTYLFFFHRDSWENDPFFKIICPDTILWLVICTDCPGCFFPMSCTDFTHRNELRNPVGAYSVMYMAIMCINIVSTGQFNSTLNQWMFGPQNLFFYSKDHGIQPMPLLGKGMCLS